MKVDGHPKTVVYTIIASVVLALAFCIVFGASRWYRSAGELEKSHVILMPEMSNEPEQIQKADAPTSQSAGAIAAGDYQPLGMPLSELRTLCGVNCLFLINQFYGIDVSYTQLRELLNPGEAGVSMARLVEVAEALGYETKAIYIKPVDIIRFRRPMIALFHGNPHNEPDGRGHYIVVVPKPEKNGAMALNPLVAEQHWMSLEDLEKSKATSVPVLLLRVRQKSI